MSSTLTKRSLVGQTLQGFTEETKAYDQSRLPQYILFVATPMLLNYQIGSYSPSPSNASLNPSVRLNRIEIESQSGLKTYDYVPITPESLDRTKGLDKVNDKARSEGIGKLIGELDGLTKAERAMVEDMLKQGKTVEIIPRSNISGVKTPDFNVDGVPTELKTLTGTSLNTPVSKIQNGFKQGAKTVTVDGRGSGMTAEQANTVLERIEGVYKGNIPGEIEIWTVDGIIKGGK